MDVPTIDAVAVDVRVCVNLVPSEWVSDLHAWSFQRCAMKLYGPPVVGDFCNDNTARAVRLSVEGFACRMVTEGYLRKMPDGVWSWLPAENMAHIQEQAEAALLSDLERRRVQTVKEWAESWKQ